MLRILVRLAINGVALWVASLLIDGIKLAEDFWKIVVVVLIFILVINAAMLLITDALTASLEVDGFVDALLGAIVISIVSWALTIFIPDKTLIG